MCANTGRPPDPITLSSYPRAVIHVDCDAFFASCEKARDPRLEGRSVVTGKERGIVSCPSYEAKAHGITRGMRLGEAKAMCPGLVILPSDYELYSIYSGRMFTILRKFTPDVEEYSIDEAFCDLTGLRRMYRGSYADIALKIKNAVRAELGITVSVGLSLTKILAKLCSKHKKPDGFTAAPGYRLHEFLADIPVERVCGFGPNTTALLNKHGINTALEYVRRPLPFCHKLLGKTGAELWHELRGVKVYAVSPEPKEKYLSISKSKTFSPPSSVRDFVKAQMMRNLESAFIKLRRHRLSARCIIVHLRKQDFRECAVEGRINRFSSSTLDFTAAAAKLFDEAYEEGSAYRATGVVLTGLKDEGADPADLFDDPVRVEHVKRLSAAVDSINANYGKHALHVASSNIAGFPADHPRNSLAWRKTELLKGETFRRRLGIPLKSIKCL